MTCGLSGPPRRTVRDSLFQTIRQAAVSTAAAVHRRWRRTTGGGKRPGGPSDSPRFHSRGRFDWRMTGEADRRWSKASSGSNGDRRWRGRFRPGEAGLGVGEGGGGAGEGARARNRSMVAGGGRSTEGGDGGVSARAELASGRREEEKRRYDRRVPQPGQISGRYSRVPSADP